MLRREFFALSCCLMAMLTGCATPPPAATPPPVSPSLKQAATPMDFPQVRAALEQINGIEIAAGTPLRFSYPVGSLFGAAAVLPMPGGVAQLDRLVNLLKNAGIKWQMKVRAATDYGSEYDQQLASARLQNLHIYFSGSGLDMTLLAPVALAEAGAPLEFTLIPPPTKRPEGQ